MPYDDDKGPPPADFLTPEWEREQSVHNWRNYISNELRTMWASFSPEQRAAIASNADRIADREDWD